MAACVILYNDRREKNADQHTDRGTVNPNAILAPSACSAGEPSMPSATTASSISFACREVRAFCACRSPNSSRYAEGQAAQQFRTSTECQPMPSQSICRGKRLQRFPAWLSYNPSPHLRSGGWLRLIAYSIMVFGR
jgi:hypothetical protein